MPSHRSRNIKQEHEIGGRQFLLGDALRLEADAEKFKTRIEKMMLKGLAFACGFGANQDSGRCVMGMGSFETLRGIDSTSTSYSPFCYFPLFDYLQARKLIIDEPLPEDEE